MSSLQIERHDAASTLGLRDDLLDVYRAAHHDLMSDPWWHPDRFWERLVSLYVPTTDFELVAGRLEGRVLGYAFGSPRNEAPDYWRKARAVLPDLALPADDEAAYVFREFAVHPDHQRQGYGRVLHDDLLASRPERLAHLLVRPDNIPARTAYVSWGWRMIGHKQPFPDAPVLEEMALILKS